MESLNQETLLKLHILTTRRPKRTEIINISLEIIQNPHEGYVPELFKLLLTSFYPLWKEMSYIDLYDLADESNEHLGFELPLELENTFLTPKVMCFNYLLLSLIHCLKLDYAELKFPPRLIKGLTLLTKSRFIMTRLLCVGILIQQCGHYPKLVNIILLTNLDLIKRNDSLPNEILYPLIPIEVHPISILEKLSNDEVISKIIDFKYFEIIYSKMISIFANNHLTKNQIIEISCSLKILSDACKFNPTCGEVIVSPLVKDLIELTLKRHLKMLNSWSITSKSQDDKAKIFQLSQILTISTCELIISLSRSGKILKTFIKDLSFIEFFNDILCFDLNLLPNDIQKEEIQLRVGILGSMANTIVEFSTNIPTGEESFKETPIFNIIQYCIRSIDSPLVSTEIKIKSLWILKNCLFSDNLNFKNIILKMIPVDKLFDMIDNNDNLLIKKQIWDIFRNILSISINENIQLMIENFNSNQSLKVKFGDFFKFLSFNLKNFNHLSKATSSPLTNSYKEILNTLLYMIVHLSGCNNNDIKLHLITQNGLLDSLKDILNSSATSWDFKISICLIIINLINSGNNGDVKSIKKILNDESFIDLLTNLSHITNNLDFQEKARLAIFRLSIGNEDITQF